MNISFRKLSMRKALIAAALVAVSTGSLTVITPAPASALANYQCLNQQGATEGRWDNTRDRPFYGNGWCMQGNYRRLVFQSDGNLVAYEGPKAGGPARWSSGTVGRGHQLVFSKAGDVRIYDSHGVLIWSNNAKRNTDGVFTLQFSYHSNNGNYLDERVQEGNTTPLLWSVLAN